MITKQRYTKQQYDEACRIKAEYENQPKHAFIPGEWVQVRDTFRSPWTLGIFIGVDDDGWFQISDPTRPGLLYSYEFIRRPVDVPGILIRWTGGECPVSDENARVLYMLRNEESEIAIAGHLIWKHYGANDDIIAYAILPEWMK